MKGPPLCERRAMVRWGIDHFPVETDGIKRSHLYTPLEPSQVPAGAVFRDDSRDRETTKSRQNKNNGWD